MTRREAIIAGTGALPLFGAADFWNRKKPAEWSESEVRTLLTRSPWAKAASVEFAMRGMEGGPGGGMGGPPGSMGGGMPEMHATVRWESAAPVRAATKTAAPAENTYVVSLSGMPMMGGRRRPGPPPDGAPGPNGGSPGQGGRPFDPAAMLERMKSVTKLERKGKDPIVAVKVEPKENGDARETWFYFEAGREPILADDKDVTFTTRMGPMQITATFALKAMVYQGKLEL